jgi:hypothetical protein
MLGSAAPWTSTSVGPDRWSAGCREGCDTGGRQQRNRPKPPGPPWRARFRRPAQRQSGVPTTRPWSTAATQGCAAASPPGRRAGSPGRPGSPSRPAASRSTPPAAARAKPAAALDRPDPPVNRRDHAEGADRSATTTSPAVAVRLGSSARSSNRGGAVARNPGAHGDRVPPDSRRVPCSFFSGWCGAGRRARRCGRGGRSGR